MKNTTCAICNTNINSRILYPANFDILKINEKTFSARRIPDRIHYRINKCDKCGLVYSSPIMEEREINGLYKKSNVTYKKETKYLQETYGKYFQKITNKTGKIENLLEIGCGNGFFLEKALKMGVKNVFGVEPGRDSVDSAQSDIKKNIITDIFRKDQFKNNFFDTIVMLQTLDHLIDPNAILNECFNILKPGGVIMIIVHDTKGLSVKLFGEKSPIFDIEHIYLFNKDTLKKILEKNNFKIRETFSVANTYPLSYWLRMAPLPFKNSGLNFLLTIPAGNIGIIAEK